MCLETRIAGKGREGGKEEGREGGREGRRERGEGGREEGYVNNCGDFNNKAGGVMQ